MGDLGTRTAVLLAALVMLGVGVALCAARIVRGPTHFDRVMALDCLVLELMGLALVLSSLLDTTAFIDVVLVVTLLGFLGTVALSAYLEGSLVD